MERADHPHQAAVHLMSSLKCCKQCYDVSEADLLEIRDLEYRKQLLAEELRALNYRSDSVSGLRAQIKELELLVHDLRIQNAQAERIGVDQIGRMSSGRAQFENQQRQGILVQLNAEKELTHQLSLELQHCLERVKYLNRINNELIYNFCSI